jgi:Protein of unknown function (DUF3795)
MTESTKSPGSAPGAPVPPTAAVCGLFCESCSIYIASHEDAEWLANLADRFGQSVEDTYCDGCRADRRMRYCRSCALCVCAAGRGHSFCNECSDFPCEQLKEFQRELPHRAELWESLDRVAEVGVEAWLAEAKRRYSCPSCGTLNSAYGLKCRSCGHEPANEYVAAHRAAILERLSQL